MPRVLERSKMQMTVFEKMVLKIQADVESMTIPGRVMFEVEKDPEQGDAGHLLIMLKHGETHMEFTVWIFNGEVRGIAIYGGYFTAIKMEDIGTAIKMATEAVDVAKRQLKSQIMKQF